MAARSPASAESLAAASGLAAGYGGAAMAIEGVSFELRGGARIGVLGPNGGGKSSLFRVLLGELEPARGRVPPWRAD